MRTNSSFGGNAAWRAGRKTKKAAGTNPAGHEGYFVAGRSELRFDRTHGQRLDTSAAAAAVDYWTRWNLPPLRWSISTSPFTARASAVGGSAVVATRTSGRARLLRSFTTRGDEKKGEQGAPHFPSAPRSVSKFTHSLHQQNLT